jgi:hypothetical protein
MRDAAEDNIAKLPKAEIRPQKGKRDHHAVLANRLLSGYYRGAKENPLER